MGKALLQSRAASCYYRVLLQDLSENETGKLLKYRVFVITKWGNRCYKIEQVLQIRAKLLKSGAGTAECKMWQLLHMDSTSYSSACKFASQITDQIDFS